MAMASKAHQMDMCLSKIALAEINTLVGVSTSTQVVQSVGYWVRVAVPAV